MRSSMGRLLAPLALALLAAPLPAAAQRPARVFRLGALFYGMPGPSSATDAFRQGLRDLGYIEGQNIVLEWRFAGGKAERLPGLAAELVGLKVDVIVTGASPAPQAAKSATREIPIIFGVAGDPVAEGLVSSLARPGGNVTGLSSTSPDLVGKQLELLKEAAPKVSRVAILRNPDNPSHEAVVREADSAARMLGVQLHIVEARGPAEIDVAFAAMTRLGAGGVLVLRDALFFTQLSRIATLDARSRLPIMYGIREHVDAGGLMSYGASLPAIYRRAATYVDKILKGAKPADLPVEQPTRFELVVNLKTAKALGLTIPPSVMIRADQVIQ